MTKSVVARYIALIEERDGKYYTYELKTNTSSTATVPAEWVKTYGEMSPFALITPNTLLEFIRY